MKNLDKHNKWHPLQPSSQTIEMQPPYFVSAGAHHGTTRGQHSPVSAQTQGPALSPVSPDTGASTLPCQLGYHVLKNPSWRRLVYKLKWAPRWTQSKTEVFWEVKVKSVTLTTSPSQIWSWHHKPKRQCGRRDSEKLSQSELVWPALGSCQEVTRWQRRPGWSTCCIWDVPQH